MGDLEGDHHVLLHAALVLQQLLQTLVQDLQGTARQRSATDAQQPHQEAAAVKLLQRHKTVTTKYFELLPFLLGLCTENVFTKQQCVLFYFLVALNAVDVMSKCLFNL